MMSGVPGLKAYVCADHNDLTSKPLEVNPELRTDPIGELIEFGTQVGSSIVMSFGVLQSPVGLPGAVTVMLGGTIDAAVTLVTGDHIPEILASQTPYCDGYDPGNTA